VTRRVLLIVAVALVAFTVGSIAPSGAGTLGGTTVSTSGPVTTITVHLDICCSSAAAHAEDQSLFNEYATQAANLWNQAFAKLLAQGCDLLHLSIDAHVLNTGDRWDPGFHQITINFDKPGRDGINELPGSTLPATADWTDPYTSALTGNYFLPDLTARIFAHETGHLLGLGDDYTDQLVPGLGPRSIDLPGREGTLMDGGDTIDQNLVDRIAAEAEKAGNTLPTCQHWNGTMTADSSRAYLENDNGPYSCHDSWSGTLSFNVSAKNEVSGSGTLNLTGYHCDFPNGEPPASPQVTFTVSGTRNTSGFSLHLAAQKFADSPPATSEAGISSLLHDPSCTGPNPGPVLLTPLIDPTHASGSPNVRTLMGAGCGGSTGDVLTANAAISLTKSGS